MDSAPLHPINKLEDAPEDAFLLYNLNGGIYYVLRKDYPSFARHWCRLTRCPSLTMDLASTRHHSVVFDLDQPAPNMLGFIESLLKSHFLGRVEHFTYIIALREQGSGIHVHLPEFEIGHDDYILLCEKLYPELSTCLDTVANVMLSGAGKPHTPPYSAHTVTYVDERWVFTLHMDKLSEDVARVKKSFRYKKSNESSFFRKLLREDDIAYHVKCLMMPFPFLYQPVQRLCFTTHITMGPSDNLQEIATFSFHRHTAQVGYISKGSEVLVNKSYFLETFEYLKRNMFAIADIQTNNFALNQWYKRLPTVQFVKVSPLFDDLNQQLREDNWRYQSDPNPIKTVMEYNEGYYFLPMFYSLCKHLKESHWTVMAELKKFIDAKFHEILDRLSKVSKTHLDTITSEFTINTFFFCANNLCDRHTRLRDKLGQVVHDSRRDILNISTPPQLLGMLRKLQERYFPIAMLIQRSSLKKPSNHIWNCLTETWQEIFNEKEKDHHISNLWKAISTWMDEFRKAGGKGGPSSEVMQSFQLQPFLSSINSDSSMERKEVSMDRHKWLLRTRDGLLDLLTGHVGGTVPELFLSDRRLGVDVDRFQLMTLCNRSAALENLYHVLTSRAFFQEYMTGLFRDVTGSFYQTLVRMVPDADPHAESMLHFYMHLCKFMSFDRCRLLYLLDVLASVFIAGNYARKFFVLKGDTRNGKSKLFEILGKTFGGYYHNIQSENLKSSGSNGSPNSELALTLFCCRIVAMEELEGKLNENRVKQITGNSHVTFRSLYELSQGGIPTAKIFTTTNNCPECNASEAFKDRATAIPFESTFVDRAPERTSEQMKTYQYPKEENVVENSNLGCFLMLYYHLKHHMKDGLLPYRDEPDSVVEYTNVYLQGTDVYNQFKTHMDVQETPGGITTQSDLQSAVRQFLKATKNTTTPESDIMVAFYKQFEKKRQMEVELDTVSYSSIVDSFEEESRPKKRKAEIMLYEGVVIRNLKRTE